MLAIGASKKRPRLKRGFLQSRIQARNAGPRLQSIHLIVVAPMASIRRNKGRTP